MTEEVYLQVMKHLAALRMEILTEAQKFTFPEEREYRAGMLSAAGIAGRYRAQLVLEVPVGQEGEVVR